MAAVYVLYIFKKEIRQNEYTTLFINISNFYFIQIDFDKDRRETK